MDFLLIHKTHTSVKVSYYAFNCRNADTQIQIPEFSERPQIVPHEVLNGLNVVARASLAE